MNILMSFKEQRQFILNKMNLLIITQKVNKADPVLGFFHEWILEFSKNLKNVTVICLEKGEYDLPENVRVLSLGKEAGVGKIGILWRLYKYVWQYRDDYDAVFVHMNQSYVIFCGLFWRIFKKKISLWYAHGGVSASLKFAEKIVDIIFTSTSNGFRLPSKKVRIVGQGIDTNFFIPNTEQSRKQNNLLTVSRISKTKRIDLMIGTLSHLPSHTLDIVGDAITEPDKQYMEQCKQLAKDLIVEDRIIWHGAVTHAGVREFYQKAGAFINLSETGSLDKVILEAIACNTPVISSNIAARDVLGVYMVSPDIESVLQGIIDTKEFLVSNKAREDVTKKHGLGRLISILVEQMK